jgi:hypothetical protein
LTSVVDQSIRLSEKQETVRTPSANTDGAILTEDQRRRLEEMLGEPFKGEILEGGLRDSPPPP